MINDSISTITSDDGPLFHPAHGDTCHWSSHRLREQPAVGQHTRQLEAIRMSLCARLTMQLYRHYWTLPCPMVHGNRLDVVEREEPTRLNPLLSLNQLAEQVMQGALSLHIAVILCG